MSKAPMPDTVEGEAPMPSSFDEDLEFWDEGRWAKLGRRLKEEPLIPLGLGLTCYALYGAARSIRRGDKETTNRYFRARLYAQGFTIVVLCAGAVYWREDRQKRKHYQGLLGEKRAQEKKQAWIRELEMRDREDELERQKRQARREREKKVPAVAQEKEEKEAKPKGEGNTDPLGQMDMRELLLDSRILGPAMMMWWSRDR